MPPQILPVDPSLDDGGRLRVLIPLLGEKSSVPVPPPALNGSWDFELEARSVSTSASVDLGVSAVFKGSTSVNSTTLVWNALVGKRAVLDTPTADSVMFESMWAVGLRVMITFTTTEIAAGTDVAVVAASTDFKGSDVQYELHSIGLGPKELAKLLRKVPPLGRFDLNMYWQLEDVRKELVETLKAALPKSGDPKDVLYPMQVSVSASPFHETVDEAAVHNFVMKCVAAGLDLNQTQSHRQQSAWKHLKAERVAAVFKNVTGGAGKPAAEAVGRASKWLQFG